jgi:hypothetical protein
MVSNSFTPGGIRLRANMPEVAGSGRYQSPLFLRIGAA